MVTATPYVPNRGDVIWLQFDPQAGHEQAGRRPALVLSPASYNAKANLVLVCPITSQVKGYPFEVVIPSGLAVKGAVLSDQLKNVDYQARSAQFLTTLPDAVVQDVINRVSLLIG